MKRASVWLNLLLLNFSCGAQADLTATNDDKASADQAPLAPLIRFVLAEGKPNNAETYIVENLSLSHQDVPVIQKGWRSTDGMNHLAAISNKNHDDVLIFIFNKDIEGVCWLTSKSGQVRSTVAFKRSAHTSRVIDNELDLKAFEQEKKFLLGRIYAAEHRKQ